MANTNFIKILDMRIRITTIKRYRPYLETRLDVYHNTSRSKIEMESFTFATKSERDGMLSEFDHILL